MLMSSVPQHFLSDIAYVCKMKAHVTYAHTVLTIYMSEGGGYQFGSRPPLSVELSSDSKQFNFQVSRYKSEKRKRASNG